MGLRFAAGNIRHTNRNRFTTGNVDDSIAVLRTVDAGPCDPAAAAAALRKFDENVRNGVKEFSWFIFRMTNPTIRDRQDESPAHA